MVIDLLDDLTLDPHIIRILRERHMERVKEIQADILAELPAFSGAMKKIGEDISILSELLYKAANEAGQGKEEVWKIDNLSQRLISGFTDIGMILSQVGLWRINKDYLECQSEVNGEIKQSVSIHCAESLRKLVPRTVAEWLDQRLELQPAVAADSYREAHFLLKEASPKGYRLPEELTVREEQTPAFPPSLVEIIADPKLLADFRRRLAQAENLRELISSPPELVIDARRRRCFYRGIAFLLTGKAFDMLALLAGSPGKLVTRAEIYDRIWAEGDGDGDDNTRPYDRQITDHKYRISAGIAKAAASAADAGSPARGEMRQLIVSRFGSGYILNLPPEEICILP